MSDLALALASVLDLWGKDAAYTPPDAEEPAATVTVVFDEAHEFVEAGGEVTFSTTAPAVLVALHGADVAAKTFPEGLKPKKGGVFAINGTDYKVVDFQPDGQGGALCPLHEAS